MVFVPAPASERPSRAVETVSASVLIEHPEVRGDNGVFKPRPVHRRQETAKPPEPAVVGRAIDSRHHDLFAGSLDADRGAAVEAALPVERVRLVARGVQNALRVFLDECKQVVRASAGEGGGGQRHRRAP